MPDTNNLDNVETQPKSASPTHSNKSHSSSPSHSTLLVIDDSSDSDEITVTNQINHIPAKPQPTTNLQISHLHLPSRHDSLNKSIAQQRRRNSSIAKLLGGQPLHNQQYEEINQQIIDDQTAQNMNNNHDTGNDGAIQRTRSSITRTLLMNSDRTNSMGKITVQSTSHIKTLSGSSYAKDFEYLIHRELDNDHGSAVNQRNNSAPKAYPNLKSSSNPPTQSLNLAKAKRKRQSSKTPSNNPPFSLHDPFELQTSSSSSSPPPPPSNNTNPSINPSPNNNNKYVHFESSKRPCYSNHQSYDSSTANLSSSNKSNHRSSSPYSQFSIHDNQRSASNCSSPSCKCAHTPDSGELTSAAQVAISSSNDSSKSARKVKSMLVQPDDIHDSPRQRSYSNLSDSSPTTIPLKKRLLDAYNHEH